MNIIFNFKEFGFSQRIPGNRFSQIKIISFDINQNIEYMYNTMSVGNSGHMEEFIDARKQLENAYFERRNNEKRTEQKDIFMEYIYASILRQIEQEGHLSYVYTFKYLKEIGLSKQWFVACAENLNMDVVKGSEAYVVYLFYSKKESDCKVSKIPLPRKSDFTDFGLIKRTKMQ